MEVVNGKLVHSSAQGVQVLAREVTRLTWRPMPDGSIVVFDQLDGAWPVPACYTGTFKTLAHLARVPIRLSEAKTAPAIVPEGVATAVPPVIPEVPDGIVTTVPPVIPEGVATISSRPSLNALCGLSPSRKSGIGHASPVTTAKNACESMLGPTMATTTSQSRASVKMHNAIESHCQLLETNSAGTIQLRGSEVGGSCGAGSMRSPVSTMVSDEALEEGASVNQRVLDSEVIDSVLSPSGIARLEA